MPWKTSEKAIGCAGGLRTPASRLAHPLRIVRGAVEVVGCLERLVLTRQGRLPRLGEDRGHLRPRGRPERTSRLEGLVAAFHALAARDDDRRRQSQRVVQTLAG